MTPLQAHADSRQADSPAGDLGILSLALLWGEVGPVEVAVVRAVAETRLHLASGKATLPNQVGARNRQIWICEGGVRRGKIGKTKKHKGYKVAT